ncbi:MAG TPA: hypothetical protein DDX92_01930 [Flavobacteriales bacterium]|jgi:hypothetical protein|nr:hypothetical protein [Flavobacteriales bacterium]
MFHILLLHPKKQFIMKKLLLFISIIAFASISFGQISIKPALGVNFSTMTDAPSGFDSNMGVSWQIGGSVAIGKKLYVEPGIFWWNMTQQFSSSTAGFGDVTQSLAGLRIPVFVGYSLLGEDDGSFNLRVFTGPALKLITSASSDPEGLDTDDFNSTIFGWNAGAGVSILFLFADLGYEFGLSDVYSSEYADLIGTNSKYGALWLNAGVRFNF